MKLTVKEYSTKFKITAQAVYQKINKGTLDYIKENGKKYIIVDEADVKELEQPINPFKLDYNPFEHNLGNFMSKEFKKLFKQIKSKDKKIEVLENKLDKRDKEIKRLNKKLVQSVQNEKHTLLSFINEQKKLLEHKIQEEDHIDVTVEKSKKKKSNKKKGK